MPPVVLVLQFENLESKGSMYFSSIQLKRKLHCLLQVIENCHLSQGKSRTTCIHEGHEIEVALKQTIL